ncbi:hypothetical protein V1506DRAFT_550148 [Lipomyces tetrasporus]
MNMESIRNEKVTITTIDQRSNDLGTENVPIYRVQGQIPAVGHFEAETIELPLWPDTDRVLGADRMREVGLLDFIEKKLGIVKTPWKEQRVKTKTERSTIGKITKTGKMPLMI